MTTISITSEQVVVPSLTPENYNPGPYNGLACVVVVPSLTPENYNSYTGDGSEGSVVVPSLTPENYNHPYRR